MKTQTLRSEVATIIDDKLKGGAVIQVDWMTREVLNRRSGIEGDDADFYRGCAYRVVKRIVRECIGKYDTKTKTDDQLSLDGFEYVQRGYTVERNGERVLVPTDQLTRDEVIGRIGDLRNMAQGCVLHAEELEILLETRSFQNVAA